MPGPCTHVPAGSPEVEPSVCHRIPEGQKCPSNTPATAEDEAGYRTSLLVARLTDVLTGALQGLTDFVFLGFDSQWVIEPRRLSWQNAIGASWNPVPPSADQ